MTGDTKITAPGTTLTAAAGRTDRPSLDQEPGGKSRRLASSMSASAPTATSPRTGWRPRRTAPPSWRSTGRRGRFRIFASGLRNPNGLTFEPQSGALWAVVNERDELGPDLVPDYMTSVKDGAFYGWPYSYYGQHVDPRVKPQRPDLVAKAIPPDYALSSHVAPLGLAFYTGDQPAGILSRRRVRRRARQLEPRRAERLQGGVRAVRQRQAERQAQDVVTGFLNGDGQARGRPVGLAVDKSGALLIADDVGNTVWRVTGGPQASASR